MKKSLLAAIALSLSLLSTTTLASEPAESVDSRIQRLEDEINLLKRQQEVKEEVEKSKAEKTATVEYGKSGLAITSPDKNYSLKLKGYAQFDDRQFLSDDNSTGRDDVLARRLRPSLEFTAFKDFSFLLSPDFAGSSARIFDSYVNYKYSDPLQIRFGKFKPPISLAQLQSDADGTSVEGGHTLNLVPSRDIGLQIYGEIIPKIFEYQVGIFNGNQDLGNTDGDDDDKKDVIGRVFAHPFRNSEITALHGFGVGIGGSIGDREGAASRTILPSYRTPGQQTFFSYASGTFASGTQWRAVPQAYFYYNNLGLLGEYAISSQEVTRAGSSDTLQHNAWQIAANYILTGEDASYRGGVKPEENFDPKNGKWGAFEAVARIGEIDIDNAAFSTFADPTVSASSAFSIGGGLNWYPNENFKIMIDYENTSFSSGAAGGNDRPVEHAVFGRAQFRF